MKLELDRETIENAIKGTMSISKAICNGLKSDNEIEIQMAYNAALYMNAFFGMLDDLKSAYLKTGIHLANLDNSKDLAPLNPHPIYVWEDMEQEKEEDEEIKQRLDKLIDILRKS